MCIVLLLWHIDWGLLAGPAAVVMGRGRRRKQLSNGALDYLDVAAYVVLTFLAAALFLSLVKLASGALFLPEFQRHLDDPNCDRLLPPEWEAWRLAGRNWLRGTRVNGLGVDWQ